MPAPIDLVTAISSSQSSGSQIGVGAQVVFTMATTFPVVVTGAPKLTLSNGGFAVFSGVDGNGAPQFAYTVASGDDTADLKVTGLVLNGGAVAAPGQLSFAAPQNFAIGSYASYAVMADFNGDGKVDIVAPVGGNQDSVALLLGNGDGTFQSPQTIAINRIINWVATADVNKDGKSDLLVLVGGGDVDVALGNGDGTFQAVQSYGANNGAYVIANVDVNNDGNVDIITANNVSNSVSVLIGNGDGTFQARHDFATDTEPQRVTAADVNNDGKIDLITANEIGNDVSVLLGNGDGTFQSQQTYATGSNPLWVATADVNGDGNADILVPNSSSNSVSVLLGNGDGTFKPQQSYAAGTQPLSVEAVDANGDGKLDLVVGAYSGGVVNVLLGHGDGSFGAPQAVGAVSYPYMIMTNDLNGDGKVDVVAINASDHVAAVLLNTSVLPSTFDASGIAGVSGADTGVAIDATAPSLAITSAGGATDHVVQTVAGTIDLADAGRTISIYDGTTLLGTTTANGGGAWSATVTFAGPGGHSVTAHATDIVGNSGASAPVVYSVQLKPAARDFDGGGMSDILLRETSGVTYLWTMSGSTVASGAPTSVQVDNNWRIKGVADFNGDRASDILWVYNNGSNSSDPLNGVSYVSLQNGATATGGGVVQQLSAVWQVAGVGDFNDDGKADVLYRNTASGQTYLDIMNGASVVWGSSGFTSSLQTDQSWQVAAVADFNGDGNADVLWRYDNLANSSDALNGTLYEWTMNGKSVSSAGLLSQQASANWNVAGAGDFNGDGMADILFRYDNAANTSDPLNGITYIGFMNGTNVLPSSAPTQWQVDNSWAIASIGDFNGDGMSDLMWRQASSGATYAWQMNGANVTTGGFTSQQAGAGWAIQNGVLIG